MISGVIALQATMLLWRADQNVAMLAGVDKYVITEEIRWFTVVGGIICWTALQPCRFLEQFFLTQYRENIL